MRISKMRIHGELTSQVGLKPIDLTDKPLGSTIALVGKNGAGKTRILNFVAKYNQIISLEDFLDDFITFLPAKAFPKNDIDNLQNVKNIYKKYKVEGSENPLLQQQYVNNGSYEYSRLKQYATGYIKLIDNDILKVINDREKEKDIINFESLLQNNHIDTFLKNPITQPTGNNLSQKPKPVNEFLYFNNNTIIDYFIQLSTKLGTIEFNQYLKNKDNLQNIKEELSKQEEYKHFQLFTKYVKDFLGKDFSYETKTKANVLQSILTYNNKPFNIVNFSPGQRTLFAYAIMLFFLDVSQGTNIHESIIILDEPEKHLHPEAQIALINTLKKITAKSGQLWIATHSVDILSHLNYDEIIMVKDDEIIKPSRITPGNSLIELMGMEGHIQELSLFINSISEWAYSNFMVECFSDPNVVFNNNQNDQQFQLFCKYIKDSPKIDLLDYGAGKGRFGVLINENSTINNKINYYGYEPNKETFNELKKISSIKGVFSELENINPKQFDYILLCNVLHEINPVDWLITFNRIKSLLKDKGYLIIIEDKFLPHGENANSFGYLILDNKQLNILFNLGDEGQQFQIKDHEQSGRIMFFAISKEKINPSNQSIIDSISALNEAVYSEIKKIRQTKDKDLNFGRIYANNTQLYINSKLALEKMVFPEVKLTATIEVPMQPSSN